MNTKVLLLVLSHKMKKRRKKLKRRMTRTVQHDGSDGTNKYVTGETK